MIAGVGYFQGMQRAIVFALLLAFPAGLHAGVIRWEGQPISVSISTERLTRIESPESLRTVFLSRSDIAVEKEDGSLYGVDDARAFGGWGRDHQTR
jgi:hypothetical protein